AEQLGEAVHGAAGLAHEEDRDRDDAAGGRTEARVDIEQRVRAESGARDVADVEREAAERDEYGERVAETGEHQVRDVLRPSFGDGDDAPDVELCGDVEQDGDENREAEAGAEPRREDGRLGEETGAHGG